MEGEGVDLLLASTPGNIYYLSEYESLSQAHIRRTQVYLLYPGAERLRPALIAHMGDLDVALEEQSFGGDLLPYGTFYVESASEELLSGEERYAEITKPSNQGALALSVLKKAITELGPVRAKIAVEAEGFDGSIYGGLKEAFPGCAFTDGGALLRKARMVKTAEEAERLKMAVRIAEEAMESALSGIRPGITEKEIAAQFELEIIRRGAKPALTVIGFGRNGAFPNHTPGATQLKRGDMIRFDIGCRYKKYYSDIARTFSFGEPSPAARGYCEALAQGVKKAISAIKPGLKAKAIFDVAQQTVRQSGLGHYKRHHCGHGIGLELYDPPSIAPSGEDLLEEGMVLCIETPFYELGKWGLQVEDEVLVQRDGPEVLNRLGGELRIL